MRMRMKAVCGPSRARTSRIAAAIVTAGLVIAPAHAQELLFELKPDTPPPRDAGEQFGWCCLGMPDLDGDGIGELLVGANLFHLSRPTNDGALYLFSGATRTKLRKHFGSNGQLGTSLDGGLDVDADGVADYVVGEPLGVSNSVSTGLVHVFSGATQSLIWTFTGEQNFDQLGASVALIPDVDGDGHADVVATAMSWDNPVFGLHSECGRGYCWSGATGALLWTIDGAEVWQLLTSCTALGDLDGDGIVEVAFGSTGSGNTGTREGKVEIVRGSDGVLIRTIVGAAANDEFGTVRGCGDLDGDGIDDLLIGAASANVNDRGRVSGYSGATGLELTRWDGTAFQGRLRDGARRALRDWDGDGHADALFGEPQAVPPDCAGGHAELRSGRTGRLLFDYRSRNDLGVGPSLGWSCSVADDLNGDGIPEVMVAAPGAGAVFEGRVYVFAGDDLFLQADQSDYDLNDDITVELRGGTPGVLGMIALTEIDGVPLFLPLVVAPLDANGELAIDDTADATYLGHSLRMKGWCLPPGGRGKLIDSGDEWFRF